MHLKLGWKNGTWVLESGCMRIEDDECVGTRFSFDSRGWIRITRQTFPVVDIQKKLHM
jgi:hypothetical protein